MNIRKLHIKGYKSVANLTLRDVSPLLVFAGANGSGKSNIVDALAFLGAVVKFGALQARTQFGGFSQIHCFKYRKEQRTTISFSMVLELAGSLYDYTISIHSLDKAPQIVETLKVDGLLVIDRRISSDTKVQLTEQAGLQSLPDYPKDMTALMLLGQSPLYAFLANIKVFRFDPLAAKEPSSSTTDTSELDAHGKNVASMLSVLQRDADFREQVLEWLELIVPGMENVSTEQQRLDGSTVITFKEVSTKNRFPAKLVSDGTIFVLCILTAVLSRAHKSGITIIEEPERGIHPKAISELVQLMRESASVEHPIFLTTHSESIVRSLETPELYFVSKADGRTQVQPATSACVDKAQIPLDTAWLSNLFDGGLPW
ncbi:AAA family ATPase [Pseudomonas aeruginosa]|uniref:AAA family ATPase n=1 Tax=Pseudomonas aeruginosa TaxID=287 RepID=UPI000F525F99|nr:AAA family ATPase [Pseudomonas aeruginosa]RPV98696.1 ABC transporter ATP-binding protein [Pseudomonas aeruginosa]WCW08887.1 AAA family ATPase [Pseudomonas aeruginosa]